MEQRDKRSSVFPYDVAISFAEEDRNIAVALEANFKLKNIKAYYYPESGAETLGHELGERLSTLYKEEAEYVVLILSQHYLNKQFCQLEMKAILERLGESEDRCLVLITTDDKTAEDIGLAKDFARIRWKHNPREVADLIWEMLGKPESEEVKEIDQTTKKSTFNVQAGTIKNNVSADTVHGGIHFGKDNS